MVPCVALLIVQNHVTPLDIPASIALALSSIRQIHVSESTELSLLLADRVGIPTVLVLL